MAQIESYRYAAFISYRHVEPDRKWAKWLHRALETFRTPKSLIRKGVPARVGRVFRDEDELPASPDLSQEINRALEQSRFLIVVCSPRTPPSKWVNQEVVRFREMGRHDRILALLIEGEPGESFPKALCEIRTEITHGSGEATEEIEEVEPLAADVRESRGEPQRILRRMALLRFSAALLGRRFDDLRQREQHRQRKRLLIGLSALLTLVVILAGLSVFAFRQQAVAEAALVDVLRLSDSKRARDLLSEADQLWPLQEDQARRMSDWIGAVRKVLQQEDAHRGTLDLIRRHALPYSDEDRMADRARMQVRLDAAENELSSLEQEISRVGRARPDQERRRAQLKAVVDRLERAAPTRETWRFADQESDWLHRIAADLLADLERIAGDTHGGILPEIEGRYAFVTSLRSMTVVDQAENWRETIEGVSASPVYAGLKIRPQLGLIPLGPDRDTHLFEFAHVGSGTIPRRDPQTGKLNVAEDAAVVLTLIPGGEFHMGAQSKSPEEPNFDPLARPDECDASGSSVRKTIHPFFLAKHECTQSQWAAMTRNMRPSRYNVGNVPGLTDRNPVEQISWNDSATWLARHRLVLPTEAQWEYACRAGTTTPWHSGWEIASLEGFANVADDHFRLNGGPPNGTFTTEINDGHSVHAPAGSYAPNRFGLYDMHGNVWEWCADKYGQYGAAPDAPPRGGSLPQDRVARGGSWYSRAPWSRSAWRDKGAPTYVSGSTGVRPAARLSTD